ncbi:MAG: FxLYD domain-containing protein [Coriobacteriales bacterium]|nr:FxLYD domain-containing protein [Coriobacteriales bacterium]
MRFQCPKCGEILEYGTQVCSGCGGKFSWAKFEKTETEAGAPAPTESAAQLSEQLPVGQLPVEAPSQIAADSTNQPLVGQPPADQPPVEPPSQLPVEAPTQPVEQDSAQAAAEPAGQPAEQDLAQVSAEAEAQAPVESLTQAPLQAPAQPAQALMPPTKDPKIPLIVPPAQQAAASPEQEVAAPQPTVEQGHPQQSTQLAQAQSSSKRIGAHMRVEAQSDPDMELDIEEPTPRQKTLTQVSATQEQAALAQTPASQVPTPTVQLPHSQQLRLQERRTPGVVEVVSPTVVTSVPEEIPFSAYNKSATTAQAPAQELNAPAVGPDGRTITISLPAQVSLKSVFFAILMIAVIVLLCIQIYALFFADKQDEAPETNQSTEQPQGQVVEDPTTGTSGEENPDAQNPSSSQSSTQYATVPSLYHIPLDQAESALQQAGLAPYVSANDDQTIGEDRSTWIVIAQDPSAGTSTPTQTQVSLTVARIEIDTNAVISPVTSSNTQSVTGTFQNVSPVTLEFVEIEFGLYNANGTRIGTARFSKESVSPNEVVSYEALAFLEGNSGPATGVKREKITYRLPS